MKAIIGILIFAAACGAQQPCPSNLWIGGRCLPFCEDNVGTGSCVYKRAADVPAPPKPLHCGKYQHVDHWPGVCGPAPCDEKTGVCTAMCTPPPPDKCVDDLHPVTEREWQETMERLAAMEKYIEESVCFNTGYKYSINVDGKHFDCATLKPKELPTLKPKEQPSER
jgi:hypothetical protein